MLVLLPPSEGKSLDMRSAAYSSMWKPKQATLLEVRAFTEKDGR